MITFPVTEAEQLALAFLMEDLEIPEDDREFFSVLASRLTDNDWYVVEVGIEGLPDKWVFQVFNTGECDPCLPLFHRSPLQKRTRVWMNFHPRSQRS
jgi:hypothetical protein